MLWNLHIELSSKIGLIAVFATGYCVLILSTIRLTSVVGIGEKLEQDLPWNLAYPQILITVELSVALISSCLPSIFNLVKHGFGRLAPTFFVTLRRSEPVGGPASPHMGSVGNSIDDHRGFVQLPNGKGGSNERLYDGTAGVSRYITAYPGIDKDRRATDPEGGIPPDQIYVREDTLVDGLNGRSSVGQNAHDDGV